MDYQTWTRHRHAFVGNGSVNPSRAGKERLQKCRHQKGFGLEMAERSMEVGAADRKRETGGG